MNEKTYESIKTSAYIMYAEVVSLAGEEYRAVKQPAWIADKGEMRRLNAAFNQAKNSAWAEYRRVACAAWTGYEAAERAAWAEYDKTQPKNAARRGDVVIFDHDPTMDRSR